MEFAQDHSDLASELRLHKDTADLPYFVGEGRSCRRLNRARPLSSASEIRVTEPEM